MPTALHPRPGVPLEIAEDIIDQLGRDSHESSLRNCALVCQAWYPRSRGILFRTVHIVDLRALRSLRPLLVSSPVLRQAVQSVTLEGIPLFSYWDPEATDASSAIFDSAPLVLLPLLPNLRSWTCRGKINYNYSCLQLQAVVLACLPRHSVIHDLSLVNIYVPRMTDILRLLLALPALRSLQAMNISFSREGMYLDRLLDRLPSQLRLSVLQICNVDRYSTPTESLSLLHTLEKAVAPHVSYLAVDVNQIATTADRFNMEQHEAIPPGSLAPYCSLVTLTVMFHCRKHGDPHDDQYRLIDLDDVRHIVEVVLPPTVSVFNIDLTQFSSLQLSRYLLDSKIVSMSREQWERLDKVLTVAKDLHPRLRDIRIVLPRASQRHTDRWTLAIQALLPESIARSLCYIVSNVEHTTSRWTYRHLPGRLAILVAAPAGTLIVSYSSDSIHSWDTEYEGLKSTVIDWADKPGLPPVYASQLIPYSNIITLKGSPWKRYPNTFAIVDSEFHDIRPMSANGYEILTYVLCCSPPSIISISLDGEVRAVSMDSINTFDIDRSSPSIPPRVHPTSSRLRAGSFAVSPGEGWLADWHTPGMVLVWDIVAESPTLHSRFIFPSLSAHTTPRSPDPEFLLAATFDNLEEASHSLCHLVGVSNRGAVWRWDVLTGAPVRRPWMLPHASELSSGGTSSITFSRSGLRLAWICPDRGSLGSAPSRGPSTVRVFNLSHSQPGTGGRQTRSVVLEGHDGAVNAIALTSWGDYIATASADHTVRLWRTEDGECVRTLTEHEAAVTHVLFSAYDGVLASGAEDGTVCVRKMEDVSVGRGGERLARASY